jgi:hypothetical protein
MDDELILALVGIGFAIVALGVLAVVQQNRIKREKQKKAEAVKTTGSDDAEPGPYFIAQYRGSKARFFRGYQDEDALLFLYAGPFMVIVGAETARGTDQRGWVAQSAKLLLGGLAVGAVVAIAIIVIIGKNVAANANNNPEAAGSIMYGVIGLIGLLAVVFAVAIPGVVWRITRRAAELNAMSLGKLRRKAESEDWSFRASPANVTNVKFAVLDLDRNDGSSCATLSFRHKPTGKWKIETTTTRDTRDAITAFREVFGNEAIEVEAGLEGQPTNRLSKGKKGVSKKERIKEEAVARLAEDDTAGREPPRFGFPLHMVAGYLIGTAIAGVTVFILSQNGRFSYTGLFQMLIALSTMGTYIGHVIGAFQNKQSRIKAFGPMPFGAMIVGAVMLLGGSFAVMLVVWSVMGTPA